MATWCPATSRPRPRIALYRNQAVALALDDLEQQNRRLAGSRIPQTVVGS